MNLDTPLFQLSARQYFEVERAVYGMTFVAQLAITTVGALVIRKAWLWWRARRERRAPAVVPAMPPTRISSDTFSDIPGYMRVGWCEYCDAVQVLYSIVVPISGRVLCSSCKRIQDNMPEAS
jgi:hypothetical protein